MESKLEKLWDRPLALGLLAEPGETLEETRARVLAARSQEKNTEASETKKES